jgi:hypothetical protein
MKFLLSLLNIADKSAVAESNFQAIDRSQAFMRTPSLDGGGDPIAVVGPPTTGARVKDELWVDSLRAVWVCTVAGTPGTWMQIEPAVVLTADKPADPGLNNYLIKIPDSSWKEQYWSVGGAAWVDV